MIRIHYATEQFCFIELEVDEPRESAVKIYKELKKQWNKAKEKEIKQKDEDKFDLGSEKTETIEDIKDEI